MCNEVMELGAIILVFFSLYVSHQSHPQENEMHKGKMVVWGHLTNNLRKKRSKSQRRKERHTP